MVEVNIIVLNGTDKKGNAIFSAEGTVGDREFVAQTIQWKGEPIFKIQEGGIHRSLKRSQFSRGERIAIARECKAARIKKFGEGHKVTMKPELDTGEVITLKASSNALEQIRGSSMAADRRRARQKASIKRHSSGLPMHASISALKRSR